MGPKCLYESSRQTLHLKFKHCRSLDLTGSLSQIIKVQTKTVLHCFVDVVAAAAVVLLLKQA
jgi:hypothetical protein